MTDAERFAGFVIAQINAKGLHPQGLAEMSDLSRVTISRHLNGHRLPHYTNRKLYADWLEMSPAEFEQGWRSFGGFPRIGKSILSQLRPDLADLALTSDAPRFTQSQSLDAPPIDLASVLAWLATATDVERARVREASEARDSRKPDDGAAGGSLAKIGPTRPPRPKSPDLNVKGQKAASKRKPDSGGEKK